MADLETLGTVPGCVAFSIGAVEFFPAQRRLGREFYAVVDVDSCLDKFLREEEGTKAWWEKQSDEAKVALHQARSGEGVPLADALEKLNGFLRACGNYRNTRLYGNGADFDNPILRCMYDAAGVDFMGSKAGFFGGRCYRTVKNLDELLGPAFKFNKVERQGTYHNALDDAKSQAVHLMDNVARIRAYLGEV
jgi:exodeoxyribonuclease VIII